MKRFSSIVILLNIVLCALAQSISFGNYTGNETLAKWGTAKAETYSVAMMVNQPSLKGSKVVAINVPVNADAPNAVNYSAFMTKELKASGGKATGDICNIEFTPSGTWNKVTLPEPYVIGDEPFYVGYTFTVSSLGTFAEDSKPLLLMVGQVTDGLMITTSRTYRKWTDASSIVGGALAVQIVLEGGGVKSNAAAPVNLEATKVKVGEQQDISVSIANHGDNAISSIEYVYEIAGQKTSGKTTFASPITPDFYGNSAKMQLTVPAIAEKGEYEGKMTITKVNDVDNADVAPSSTHVVRVMTVVPVKRPLLEEFTGTWCGYCPRGYVGMMVMNERHPGEFICASYHNGDAMQITTKYPVAVDGFPYANFDRHHASEAFYGDTNSPMGIDETWQAVCKEYTPVNVAVKANLDSEGLIHVDADYTFCESLESTNYGVAYIVTADGLSGTTKNWRQHSYFSGENGASYDGYLDQFCNGQPEYQFLVYDDVAIAQSGDNGSVITGVIPETCSEGETYSHEYRFHTATMNANYGDKENLVQDENRLNVIALIYDLQKKAVANCAKCHVEVDDTMNPDGITSVVSSSLDEATFSLDGKRTAQPVKGINIIRKGGVVKKIAY